MTSWTKYTYLNALIALVAGMERDRFYSFAEVAKLLGCDESHARTVVEQLCEVTVPDLRGLGEAIIPLDVEDEGITLHDALSFSTEHALRLDRMQTIAVVLALRMRGIDWQDELMGTLCDAVTTDAPIDDLSHIVNISPVSYRTEVMEVLAQAILDGCCAEVTYRGTARIIEPWVLLDEKDQHYVYAWCRLRGEPRMFRLDHLDTVSLLGRERAIHSFDENGKAGDGAVRAYPALVEASGTARLRFADPSAFNARAWPGARIILTTSPGLTIELPYSDPSWIARQVVESLGAVEVIGPDEIGEAVIDHTTRIRSVCGLDR